MKCTDCPLKHVRQTDRIFYTRYKEHIQTITKNNGNSGYSNQIPSTGHTHGSITDAMNIIKTEKKKHLNILEKYHTHKNQQKQIKHE
jgi:hypothetical protein